MRLICRERCLPAGMNGSIKSWACVSLQDSGRNFIRRKIRKICVSIGKTFCRHANSKTHRAVFGPTPLNEIKNAKASFADSVRKRFKSNCPQRVLISLRRDLITTDFTFASPPILMAVAIVSGRARRACSQFGKRFFKLAKARSLFAFVVDCERIVPISSSRGSRFSFATGTPYTASRCCAMCWS